MNGTQSGFKVILRTILQSIDRRLSKQNFQPGGYSFSIQNIFDHFPFWQTRFNIDDHTYGGITDYTSQRISILNVSELYNHVSINGKSVLELAPLEGGNTAILSNRGASEITAIEGRVENYIKCCVIKNLLGLDNTTFFLDDVRNLSKEKYGTFDITKIRELKG